MKLPSLTNIKTQITKTLGNTLLMRTCVAIVVFATMVLVLIYGDLPSAKKLEVGRPAPWDVKASTSVQVVDETKTRQARLNAAEQVPDIESYNRNAVLIGEARIRATFKYVRQLAQLAAKAELDPETEPLPEPSSTIAIQADPFGNKEEGGTPDAATAQPTAASSGDSSESAIRSNIPLDLKPATLKLLIKASPPTLEHYHNTASHLLGLVMTEGVRDGQLAEASTRIEELAADLPISPEHRTVATEIASKALIVNRYTDTVATQEARTRAMEQVEPVMRVVMPGQVVIREGDIVGDQDLPILEALGFYKPHVTPEGLFSYSVLVLMMIFTVGVYMRIHLPKIYNSPMLLAGLALLVIIFLVLSRYLTSVSIYLAPIAMPAMLIAILLEARLALLVVNLLALYVGIETSSLSAAAICVFTGIVGVLSVTRANKRWDMVTASLLVWGTNVLAVLVFAILSREELQDILRDTLFFGGLNGVVSALVAAGALPVLERVFRVTTHMRLLELSNPTEPVLHELLTKAPGTYQHSIMVANLAEAAASAIDADALLCRAGAYYHDIGKMKQPNMFVENQLGAANPHDKLPPSLSAMIVVSHIKHGLELAKQYDLPDIITQFIPQHHGTNLASFFFQKARAQDDEPVFEEDFRYPGPRPQIRETAIVMICDGIEAASRTLPSPTPDKLEALVNRMVSDIIDKHQLEECNLSLKDINIVKDSIVRTLTSHYHSRIVYPDADKLRVKHVSVPKTLPSSTPAEPATPTSIPAKTLPTAAAPLANSSPKDNAQSNTTPSAGQDVGPTKAVSNSPTAPQAS